MDGLTVDRGTQALGGLDRGNASPQDLDEFGFDGLFLPPRLLFFLLFPFFFVDAQFTPFGLRIQSRHRFAQGQGCFLIVAEAFRYHGSPEGQYRCAVDLDLLVCHCPTPYQKFIRQRWSNVLNTIP